jgi:nucleoside-diphosphate-sugar epimerase
MKVLIIGGDGWIASEIKPHLKKKGMELDVYDIKNGDDLFDEPKLNERMLTVDAVLHMAAIPHFDPTKRWDEFERLNVTGARNVCQAAANLGKRLVMFSSGAVYEFDGKNSYAVSKQMAEKAVEEIGGIPRVALRVNWPGGCPDKGLLSRHKGAECSWELLCQIVEMSLTVSLEDKFYVFNAINSRLRDGSPALLDVVERIRVLGI